MDRDALKALRKNERERGKEDDTACIRNTKELDKARDKGMQVYDVQEIEVKQLTQSAATEAPEDVYYTTLACKSAGMFPELLQAVMQ